MRELQRRLERLEAQGQAAQAAKVGVFFLIGWKHEAINRAECDGQVIEREGGETEEAFKARAADTFRPKRENALAAVVWID